MPVELKKGTDVRDEANLVDHPEVLGCRIGLLGLVKTYFNVVGLKNVAYHEWLTNGGDVEEPEEPEEPENPKNLKSRKIQGSRRNRKILNRDRFKKIR